MFERLTPADKTKIEDYINAYSGTQLRAPLQYILREWSIAKNEYIKNIFKDKFIIEKEISYKKADNVIMNELSDCKEITYVLDKLYAEIIKEYRYEHDQRYYLVEMTRVFHLVCNRVPKYFPTIDLRFPDGKTFKICPNMKMVKAIEKLCEKYDISKEEFEKFRIAHSRILNTAKLTGTLCASIHPLDYMTMSDNDYNWHSCMSWKRDGGYRRGTVGMMNSPSVVVVYIKGDTDMKLVGEHTWNNKKWRSLFIIDEYFISSVKSYPYYSTPLTKAAMSWFKELCDGAWTQDLEYEGEFYGNVKGIDKRIQFEVFVDNDYNAMYNDFGTDTSYISFNIEKVNSIRESYSMYHNYSGQEVCMSCGREIDKDNFDDEGATHLLCCPDCLDLMVCDDCGSMHVASNIITIDGDNYCRVCASDMIKRDFISDEHHRYNTFTKIYVIDNSEDKEVTDGYIYINTNAISEEEWDNYFTHSLRTKLNNSFFSPLHINYVYISDMTDKAKVRYADYVAAVDF